MTRGLPTGRTGQALALGIALAVPLLLWLGLVAPLAGFHQDRAEELERRQALVQRMERLAAQLPALRQQASAPAAASASALLEGESDAVAGAALQEAVQAMAAAAGAVLTSVETLPAERAGQYRRVSVRVSLNASWPVLVQLLESLAQSSPRMLVDDLQVQSSPLILQMATRPLDASFTVIGFRAAGPQRDGSG